METRMTFGKAATCPDRIVELNEADLTQVSGGRTCEGPTVCDTKGYCEDSKGVCTQK